MEEFDIEEYNFEDEDIVLDGIFGDAITITVNSEWVVALLRGDVIALAKHFKLTEEDLRE